MHGDRMHRARPPNARCPVIQWTDYCICITSAWPVKRLNMEKRNIIVIGASAGGFEALKRIVSDLPATLDAAIFVVWHISPESSNVLPMTMNRLGTLPASNAVDKEPIRFNRIYIAPPDRHLVLTHDLIRVTHGPKENRFRPAIDPLFRSAALAFGPRVIGVILSGALDDGTAGLWMVKDCGGITVVQDPIDAEVPSMPKSAIRHVQIDHRVPAGDMGGLLAALAEQDAPETGTISNQNRTEKEVDIAIMDETSPDIEMLGGLTPFTCPECHGVLSALREGGQIRYRCHTGHAFSANSLLEALSDKIEDNLWNAVRSIKECILLLNHIGDHYAEHNRPKVAALFFQKAKDAAARIELLEQVVKNQDSITIESVGTESAPIRKDK